MLSPTLRLTILRRLRFLPDDTLATLRAAAILGSGFTLHDVSVTTRRPAIDLSEALVEALRGHVLAEDGDRLRFRHDLIRDAIYEDLPLTVRRALHIEAGQRLATAGAPVLQVAEQWSRGAVRGDAEAVRWLSRAAREAAVRSPAVAASLLARALDLMLPTDESSDQVRLELATSQVLSGRLDEAAALSRSLMTHGRNPAVRAGARLCLAHTLLASGRPGEALVELRRISGTDGLPDADRAGVAAWSGLASVFVGDFDTADRLGDYADDLARTTGDAVARSIAMTVQACVRQARGELSEALWIADDALRVADASPGRAGHRYPLHIGRGSFLIDLDRLAEARSALDDARRVGEELGTRWPESSESNLRGVALFVAGEWDDAVAELEAGAELARESGESLSMIRAHATTALIRLHRNDLDGAQQVAALATRDLERIPHSPMGPWAALADALVREAHGHGEAALVNLARSWEGWRAGRMVSEFPAVGPDLVRLASAAHVPDLARQVSDDVEWVADRNQVPSITAAALRCRGLASDDPELLERAAVAYETIDRPLERALAAEDAGTCYTRRAQPARGRPLLERAASSFEKLGAVRDVLRTEATLRSVGVHRGRRGARKRPQHGWASLTPTELTVAGLVAQGLSNPQIANRLYVSRRTVQTHLSHMFIKLEITSRVHLVNEVVRHAG